MNLPENVQSDLTYKLGDLSKYIESAVADFGGVCLHLQFPNGYGASVVRNQFSYGGDRGLFEVAVLDSCGNLCYTTPVTDDVVGYLDAKGVEEVLIQIFEL